MGDVNTAITNAQQTADLEMQRYLSQMSDSERVSYAGANAKVAMDRIKALKTDRFSYLSEDLVGVDNNIVSTAYYLTRTKDLKNMATDIDKVATKQLSVSDINSGILSRQTEINEWANGNKLDTLFFLQVLFISLTFISTLYFLKSKGLLSAAFLNMFLVLTAAFAVGVLIFRARFTKVKRDGRYWSKIRYPRVSMPPTPPPACPGDTVAPPPAVAPAPVTKKVCTTVTVQPSAAEAAASVWGDYFSS